MPARETAIPMIAIVILPATLVVSANPPTLRTSPPTQSTNPANAIASSLFIPLLPGFTPLKQHDRKAQEDHSSDNEQDAEASRDSPRQESKTGQE
jgi:hypothetical protein